MLDGGSTYHEDALSSSQRLWIMRGLALTVAGILIRAVGADLELSVVLALRIFVLLVWLPVTILLFVPWAKDIFLTPLQGRLSTSDFSGRLMRKETLTFAPVAAAIVVAVMMIGIFFLDIGLAPDSEIKFLVMSCLILGFLCVEWFGGVTNRPAQQLGAKPIITLGAAAIILVIFVVQTQRQYPLGQTRLCCDQIISTYAHQTIARGEAPFEGFIILHPPLSFIVGGLTIRLGDVLNIDPVVAVRIMHAVFYTATVGILFWMGKTMSGEPSIGLLAVAMGAWPLAARPLVANGSEKFVMLVPMLIGMIFAQKRRWVLSGFFSAVGAFSWAAGFIFVGVVLGTAFLQQEESRWTALGKVVAGSLISTVLMTIYLLVTGTFRLVWRQFVVTTFSIVVSEFGFSTPVDTYGRYGDAISPRFLMKIGSLKISEWLILTFGILAALLCLAILIRSFIKKGAHSAQLPIMLGAIVTLLASAFDFQGDADFFPLIPFLSLLCAWGIWYILASRSRFGWFIVGGSIIALMVVRSFVYDYQAPGRESISELDEQRIASEWLNTWLAPDAPVQAFHQNLWPLVLTNRPNATRLINPRAGSMMAMQSEGITPAEMLTELQDIQPVIFLSSSDRIEKLGTLVPVLDWLDEEYIDYRRNDWYASPDSPINMVVLKGMEYGLNHPEILRAVMLAETEGVSDEVTTLLENAPERDRSVALIYLGHLYRDSGDLEAARSAYQQALRQADDDLWAKIEWANLNGDDIVDFWGVDCEGQLPVEAHLLLPTRLAEQTRDVPQPVAAGYYLFDYHVSALENMSLTWWNSQGLDDSKTLRVQWLEDDQQLAAVRLYIPWSNEHPLQLVYPVDPPGNANGFRICLTKTKCSEIIGIE
jgi:tetratricopeptide (TPR) repeat protein